jgi:hypothetical protein
MQEQDARELIARLDVDGEVLARANSFVRTTLDVKDVSIQQVEILKAGLDELVGREASRFVLNFLFTSAGPDSARLTGLLGDNTEIIDWLRDLGAAYGATLAGLIGGTNWSRFGIDLICDEDKDYRLELTIERRDGQEFNVKGDASQVLKVTARMIDLLAEARRLDADVVNKSIATIESAVRRLKRTLRDEARAEP